MNQSQRPPAPSRLRFSVVVAAVIVVAEYGALSFAFDVQPLTQRPDGWRIAGQFGAMAALIMAAAMGMCLVGLYLDASRLRLLLVPRPLDRQSGLLLGLHLLLFAGCWALSARIFGAAGPPAGGPLPWLLAWFLIGVAATAALFAAALPAERPTAPLAAVGPLVGGGLLVGVGAWLAARGSSMLWFPLGPWTLRSAQFLLRPWSGGTEGAPDEAIIGTATFQVHVAPECAGFEGVGLMGAFLAASLVLGRRQLRFPNALVLVPLGLVAAWVFNLLRIVALVLVGNFLSEDIAVSGFHAKAGWLLFCVLALTVAVLLRRAPFFTKHPVAAQANPQVAAFLLPFLTLLALAFATGLFTREIDLLYGVRIAGALLVLARYRAHYRGITWRGPWRPLLLAGLLGLAAFALFVPFTPHPDAETTQRWQQQWASLPGWGQGGWLVVRVLGSCLVIPVAEELAFRGYLLRRLVDRHFEDVAPARQPVLAVAVSSLAFGLVHGSWLAGTLAGLCFALAQRAGNVGHAIFAHVVANVAVAIYVLAFGQWWLWM